MTYYKSSYLTSNVIVTLKCGSEVTQVIETGTISKLVYGFLFAFHSNYGHILIHFEIFSVKQWPDLEIWVGVVQHH